MMNDRELLELAAAAAGIEAYELDDGSLDMSIDPSGKLYGVRQICGGIWNPIADDGDAFRLAYALQMDVDYRSCWVVFGEDDQTLEFLHDGARGIRRAITQAAAEIGKSMEGK